MSEKEKTYFIPLLPVHQSYDKMYQDRILDYEKQNPNSTISQSQRRHSAWNSWQIGGSRESINNQDKAYKTVWDSFENAGCSFNFYKEYQLKLINQSLAQVEKNTPQAQTLQTRKQALSTSKDFSDYAQKTGNGQETSFLTPRAETRSNYVIGAPRMPGSIGGFHETMEKDPNNIQINYNIGALKTLSHHRYETLQMLHFYTQIDDHSDEKDLPVYEADARQNEALALAYDLQASDNEEEKRTFSTKAFFLEYQFAGEKHAYNDMVSVLQQSEKWEHVKKFMMQKEAANPELAVAWEKGKIDEVIRLTNRQSGVKQSDTLGTELLNAHSGLREEIVQADLAEQKYVETFKAVNAYKVDQQNKKEAEILKKDREENTQKAIKEATQDIKYAATDVSSFLKDKAQPVFADKAQTETPRNQTAKEMA